MAEKLGRSPLLMAPERSALLVVDLQTRLVPLIGNHHQLVWNVSRLVRGAEILGIPRLGTEQYPEKLGPLVEPICSMLGPVPAKRDFSCGACGELFRQLVADDRDSLLIVGIETHVCVMQTVLDLIAEGFCVHVAVDAVGSRNAIDHQTALRRMELAGATLSTAEMSLFEWCETSLVNGFKKISQLIREAPPPPPPPPAD